jgi:hypothetical protein
MIRFNPHAYSPPLIKCNSGSTEQTHSTIQNSPVKRPTITLIKGRVLAIIISLEMTLPLS